MLSLKPKRPFAIFGLDLLILFVGLFSFVFIIRNNHISKLEWAILFGFLFIWMVIDYWRKRFYSNKEKDFWIVISYHFKAYATFIIFGILFHLFIPVSLPGKKSILAYVIIFPLVGIFLNLFVDSIKARIKSAKNNIKYTLIAGTGIMAQKVEKQLHAHRVSGHTIKGFINCMYNEDCLVGHEKVVSDLKDIRQYLKENQVDEIVIALPGKPTRKIHNILETADYYGIRVKYIPDYSDIFGKNYKIIRYGDIDAVNIHQSPIDNWFANLLKNCFDKAFSAAVLTLLIPVFIVIILLIKLDSPGPILYCPTRIGRSGRPFKVFKFRSMRENDSTTGGTLSTQKNDPRITRLGNILRKYSLDELPQFVNVLIGDMSVVGPRPHRKVLDQQLQECVYHYMIRHYIKPGITGWAQVNGWRGPTDTDEQKRQRTLHDLWYLENWSMLLDLKIIFLTIFSKKAHKSAF